MSNTLGSLSGTLILQEALALTFRERPLLKQISLGFRDLDGKANAAMLNQAVKSRIHSVSTVNTFGTGASNKVDTDVSCTLTAMKEVQHAFTPTEYNSTDRDLIRECARPMAVGISNHIIDALVRDLWLESNYPNTDTFHSLSVASAWSYNNTLRPIRKNLNKAGVPKGDRFAVFNSDVYDSLLGDTTVVAALNNPDNGGAIKSGRLPMVAGLGIDEYPDMSVNVGSAISITAGNTTTEVLTAAAHGLVSGQRVVITLGTLVGPTDATAYYVGVVSADTFKLYDTAANAITNGATGRVDITTDGTATVIDQRIGFAGTPDSSVYMARPMRNPQELAPNLPFAGACGYITEPVTGFTVLVTQWIDQATLVVNNRLSWIEGSAVGNPNNGHIVYKA